MKRLCCADGTLTAHTVLWCFRAGSREPVWVNVTDEGQDLHFISPSSFLLSASGFGEEKEGNNSAVEIKGRKIISFSRGGCWENHINSAPTLQNQLTRGGGGFTTLWLACKENKPFVYVNSLRHFPSLSLSLCPQLLCSSVQAALFEEEERGRKLQERLAAAERRNRQLKERVRKVKRSLRNARKAARKAEQEAQELQERLKAAQRRAGHHINAITQEEPPPGRYASTALRQGTQL